MGQVAGLGCSEKIIDKNFEKIFCCTFPLFLVKLLDLAYYSKLSVTQVAVNFQFMGRKLEHQVY